MLYNAGVLEGFILSAPDGEIGRVEDFYFDDDAWVIRYLVVNTGTWLSGREVLISPSSLGKVDWNGRRIGVRLSKNRVENSPDIDTHKPISRQHETDLHDYYGYPYYWGGRFLWGPVAYPGGFAHPSREVAEETPLKRRSLNALREKQRTEDQHLRSTRVVSDYSIEALDGEIGHVEDFILDDESWAIRYIVVDTRNWWPGKKVLVSPQWISGVSWNETKARVDLPRELIKQAPEYDKHIAITRDYENRVYRHYNRPGYW
jgi:hypothetical protein